MTDEPRVGRGFLAAYAAAQVAAFTSFVPLLTILLPLKAEQVDPTGKAELLSAALLAGAITAGAANLVGGILSDHTRSPWGRRAPWMVLGAVGIAIAYGLLWRADSAAGLIAGVLVFQLFLNLMFAPLVAILPDRVPDRQKGGVAALLALGYPLGAVLGALLTGRLIGAEAGRYLALAAVALSIAPLAYLLREPPQSRRPPIVTAAEPSPAVDPGARRDYAWTWLSRLLVQTAVSIASGYLLFFLDDAVRYTESHPGRPVEEGVATLLLVSTLANVAAALGAGALSDRVRRRKPFLLAAGLSMAVALTAMAAAPSWPVVVAAQLLFGAAFGCYTAVDLALVAQVIPSRRLAGRYLALMNFANTLPQVAAPLIAVRLIRGETGGYPLLFAFAGALALAGGLAIQPIRRVD